MNRGEERERRGAHGGGREGALAMAGGALHNSRRGISVAGGVVNRLDNRETPGSTRIDTGSKIVNRRAARHFLDD